MNPFSEILEIIRASLGIVDKISPALEDEIEARIPLLQQRVFIKRMRICKRYCRMNGLNTPDLIRHNVALDFKDQSIEQQTWIGDMLVHELIK